MKYARGISLNMKIPKKRNIKSEVSITCSHICHNAITKCVYWSDTQSVKVWWRYLHFKHECSSIMYQNALKTQYNQRAPHNSQLNLAYRYIKMCEWVSKIKNLDILFNPRRYPKVKFQIFSSFVKCHTTCIEIV